MVSVSEGRSRSFIEIDDATVVRDGRVILHVDRLSVRRGERVAVLGPNGAGKSTLIGLLTRDIQPLYADPYPVTFDGQERMELSAARALFGVVSGTWQHIVDVHLPVRDIVIGGLYAALGLPIGTTPTPADVAAAHEAMRTLGVLALADRDMTTLSSGEARRVLIARALVHDPEMLVLDEPCAALDPTGTWLVRDTMRHVAETGRTLIVVTHHVGDIVAAIDRVILVKGARIVADGPKSEVLNSDSLSELFGVRLELEERGGEYRLW